MLRTINLSIGFEGRALVKSIEIAANSAETIAIIGRSGSGKSTLLRTLAGVLPPVHGHVELEGKCIGSEEPARHDRITGPWPAITAVFQDYRLLPHLTVRQNCLLGLPSNNVILTRLETLVVNLALGDCIDRRPSAISHGQRQRSALLRAVLRSPKVLLLDEPSSAQDAASLRCIQHILKSCQTADKTLIIVVSHDIEFICEIADQFFEIVGDQLIETTLDARGSRRGGSN